eukprot:scaffold2822_cov176-Pinguiococcus_pyrenoidosus.AAC.2
MAEEVTPLGAGETVPSVTFKCRTRIEEDTPNPFDWVDRTTEDLFAGKKIVLFALPGAFTPTCSSTHLPGYEEHYDEFRELGVDEVGRDSALQPCAFSLDFGERRERILRVRGSDAACDSDGWISFRWKRLAEAKRRWWK